MLAFSEIFSWQRLNDNSRFSRSTNFEIDVVNVSISGDLMVSWFAWSVKEVKRRRFKKLFDKLFISFFDT